MLCWLRRNWVLLGVLVVLFALGEVAIAYFCFVDDGGDSGGGAMYSPRLAEFTAQMYTNAHIWTQAEAQTHVTLMYLWAGGVDIAVSLLYGVVLWRGTVVWRGFMRGT